jgi:hypothetical protein
MAMKGKGGCLGALILLVVFGPAAGLILMIMGDSSSLNLKDSQDRGILCFGFLLWGVVYFCYKETKWSFAFGLVQLVSAMWSNWYQLSKLAEDGLQKQFYDRLVFVAAGIAVIANGCGDLEKGYKVWKRGKETKAKKPE